MAISIPHLPDRARAIARTRRFVVLSATATLVALVLFASRTSVFRARGGVVVEGEAERSRADIVRIAGLSRDTNVLWLDEASAEARLEADPWIDDAEVAVELPWTIHVDVVERRPVAVTTDGVAATPVAADGTLLPATRGTRGLPRVELPATAAVDGARPSPDGAIAILGAMNDALLDDLVALSVLDDGTVAGAFRRGPDVDFGSGRDAHRKVEALVDVLVWAEATGERLARISVASPHAPAVRVA